MKLAMLNLLTLLSNSNALPMAPADVSLVTAAAATSGKGVSTRGIPTGWKMWPPAQDASEQCNCKEGRLILSRIECKCYKCKSDTVIYDDGAVCGPQTDDCNPMERRKGTCYFGSTAKLSCDGKRYYDQTNGRGRQQCYIGGTGGGIFDDFMDLKAYGPRTLSWRSGAVIDNVGFKYANIAKDQPNPVMHGGGNGMKDFDFVIDDDENIVKVTMCTTRQGEDHQITLSNLQVTTSTNRTSRMYGKAPSTQMCTDFELPEGHEVKSWYGRSGKYVDGLGFYYGPIVECTASMQTPRGYWKALQYLGSTYSSTAKQTFSYEIGTTKTLKMGSKSAWAHKWATKVGAGFEFGVGKAGKVKGSVEVSSEYSRSQESSVEQALAVTEKTKFEVSTGAGQMWQWALTMVDECSTSEARTRIVAVTPNAQSPPCCPPGLAKDPNDVLGECVDPKLSLCTKLDQQA